MLVSDLDAVLDIEHVSYPTPWSRKSFLSELTENIYAHYVVVESDGVIIGYCGMWVIIDEAHITNIAVSPLYRRRGVGEHILREMILRARSRGATRMTLEVRVSNYVAQRLYKRLGFAAQGIRRGYYTDTHEDAIVMWLYDLGPRDKINDEVTYK